MEDPMPGAVIAVQTFGDYLNFNPHLHIISADGCFDRAGNFMSGVMPNADDLVYHSDPLICPKCKGEMKIIAFIEEEAIIQKILKHLNLWVPRNHDPPLLSNAVVLDMPAANDAGSSDNHETLPQMPFEDEYSQLSPYEDHTF